MSAARSERGDGGTEGWGAVDIGTGSSSRSVRQLARLTLLRVVGSLYSRRPRPTALRSILLIRPDHLGDMLFLTPALHTLRRALPSARITLLAGPWSAEIVRRNPDLDAVETCPFPGFERRPRQGVQAPYRLLAATARRLRAEGYDTAVILRFDHWWGAWLAAAAGIPRRVGYDRPETRPFLHQLVSYRAGRHEVQQNATLLAALVPGCDVSLGPTCYHIAADDRAWVAERLAAHGIGHEGRLVAIHPGAGAAVKQWPVAAWAEVANRLAEGSDSRIVLTGGTGERELSEAVAALLERPALDVAGVTTLGQLAALYARCALVLGSDSGPLHLAVAVGTPTVHLYGPVSPAKFGPWGDPTCHIVLTPGWSCAPCDRLDWPAQTLLQHACMAAITPADVLGAARAFL